MSESVDLKRILQSWPYDPDQDCRITKGDDARPILQVRTPVGVEQYELDGRPDGARPHGMESALEFYGKKLEAARSSGKESDFELGPRDCAELFNEGTLYYFRYVRLFQLKDWQRTIRDTSRNLKLFDLIHRYARREEDQEFLEKWRPYILRLNFSSSVMIELDQKAYDKALALAREAVRKLEELDDLDDETFRLERERSLEAMHELANQIEKNRPRSELEKLEDQMRRAVERQEFERAAQLRDRIRALKNQQVC